MSSISSYNSDTADRRYFGRLLYIICHRLAFAYSTTLEAKLANPSSIRDSHELSIKSEPYGKPLRDKSTGTILFSKSKPKFEAYTGFSPAGFYFWVLDYRASR